MSKENIVKCSISLLVTNKSGVLVRIALVFARRGYNIESVVVSPAHNMDFSRMSITVRGEKEILEQIIKQLNKLVDVVHAVVHGGKESVEREMAMIKVSCVGSDRVEVLQIAQHFKCESVDITHESLILQVTGRTDKLDALHTIISKYKVLEYIRSGKLIIARGEINT